METTNENKDGRTFHQITLNDRIRICKGLEDALPLNRIAKDTGFNRSTISREVRFHKISIKKGSVRTPFNDCAHARSCRKTGLCTGECTNPKSTALCNLCPKGCRALCPDYEKSICPKLDKPPYVCNGCSDFNRCRLEKWIYDPKKADKECTDVRSESRSGINASEEEIEALDELISPLVDQGQSVSHILASNRDSITFSRSTVYSYINGGLLKCRNIDLPRKVRFSARKNPVHHKVDKNCTKGRTYEDLNSFLESNPTVSIVEFDSVEGKKGGKVLLTIYFRKPEVQFAFLRDQNNSRSVIDIVDHLYELLGKEIFCRLFQVILADNGTEFSNPEAIEYTEEDGVRFRRTRMFYCDPSSPGQKGGCERNHTDIRRIISKYTPLEPYTQEDISLAMDHVNSYRRAALGYKSAYDVFGLLWGKEILEKLGCRRIPDNEIILTPALLGDRLRERGVRVKTNGLPVREQSSVPHGADVPAATEP